MKTRIVFEIETPDSISVVDADGNSLDWDAQAEYADEWHKALVEHFSSPNIDSYIESLAEFYNENGNTPGVIFRELSSDKGNSIPQSFAANSGTHKRDGRKETM